MREFSDLKPLDDIPASFFFFLLSTTRIFFSPPRWAWERWRNRLSQKKTDRAYIKDLCGNILLLNKSDAVAIRILLDIHRLRHDVVPAFSVLCRNSNQVFARWQRVGEVAELALRTNQRLLAVYHHASSRFRVPANFENLTVLHQAINLQHNGCAGITLLDYAHKIGRTGK